MSTAKTKDEAETSQYVELTAGDITVLVQTLEKINPQKGTDTYQTLQHLKRRVKPGVYWKKARPSTKVATALGGSAVFGLAASAAMPMVAAVPVLAAAVGAAVGWFAASSETEEKDVKESA